MDNSYSLIATPNEICSLAGELRTKGAAIRCLASEMAETVKAILAVAWAGEDAQTYVNKFVQFQGSIEEIDAHIQEHATKLEQAAQNYKRATVYTGTVVAGLEPPL